MQIPLTLASAVSAALFPPTAGLYLTSKSQATTVPLLLASCSPRPRAAAEAPTGQEPQVGAGAIQVGCSG